MTPHHYRPIQRNPINARRAAWHRLGSGGKTLCGRTLVGELMCARDPRRKCMRCKLIAVGLSARGANHAEISSQKNLSLRLRSRG